VCRIVLNYWFINRLFRFFAWSFVSFFLNAFYHLSVLNTTRLFALDFSFCNALTDFGYYQLAGDNLFDIKDFSSFWVLDDLPFLICIKFSAGGQAGTDTKIDDRCFRVPLDDIAREGEIGENFCQQFIHENVQISVGIAARAFCGNNRTIFDINDPRVYFNGVTNFDDCTGDDNFYPEYFAKGCSACLVDHAGRRKLLLRQDFLQHGTFDDIETTVFYNSGDKPFGDYYSQSRSFLLVADEFKIENGDFCALKIAVSRGDFRTKCERKKKCYEKTDFCFFTRGIFHDQLPRVVKFNGQTYQLIIKKR